MSRMACDGLEMLTQHWPLASDTVVAARAQVHRMPHDVNPKVKDVSLIIHTYVNLYTWEPVPIIHIFFFLRRDTSGEQDKK